MSDVWRLSTSAIDGTLCVSRYLEHLQRNSQFQLTIHSCIVIESFDLNLFVMLLLFIMHCPLNWPVHKHSYTIAVCHISKLIFTRKVIAIHSCTEYSYTLHWLFITYVLYGTHSAVYIRNESNFTRFTTMQLHDNIDTFPTPNTHLLIIKYQLSSIKTLT